MGRLVRPDIVSFKNQGGLEGVGGNDAAQKKVITSGDDYIQRVAKYIPAEIVAFFIFANSILWKPADAYKSGAEPFMAGFNANNVGIAVFLLCWFLTPIFLWKMNTPGDARISNIIIATTLFPFWAYAINGVGVTSLFIPYDGQLASLMLGGATLISGLYSPTAKGL